MSQLFDIPKDISAEICTRAGRVGSTMLFMTCKNAREHVPRDLVMHPTGICAGVAADGDIPLLAWAKGVFPYDRSSVVVAAASAGHLNVINYIGVVYADKCIICEAAALHGHLNILEWMSRYGCVWTMNMCENAVKTNRFEIVKWLHGAMNYNSWLTVMLLMIEYNRIEMMKWAINNSKFDIFLIVSEMIVCDREEMFDLLEAN